jgi:hypothetical protein
MLIAVLAALIRLFGLLSAALAGPEVNLTQGLMLADMGLAFRAYDPVAYCTDGRPVTSQTTYASMYSLGHLSFCDPSAPLCLRSEPREVCPTL